MRASTNGAHVVFEYAGRSGGESYETNVALLVLSMRRRGDTAWFAHPIHSPPPLQYEEF